MKEIVVIGAGKIGSTIAEMLAESGDYAVTVVDNSPVRLEALPSGASIAKTVMDITRSAELHGVLAGKFAVLSAAPYHLTVRIAEAAKQVGAHYLDLTEDVASTRKIRRLAETAGTAFMPQCGLAPGFISVAANDLASRFDRLDDIRLGVGALPKTPSNAPKYNLTWSTEGLINEYCEPCEAIVDGQILETQPLEDLEAFTLDGVTYEAFNTSGGLGSLCEKFAGRAQNLSYRTIRYPGHAAFMKVLLNDLGLRERRDLLKDVLEHALPSTLHDVVIVRVSVSGERDGRPMQEIYAQKIYGGPLAGRLHSAIQITTSAGICAMLDLLATGVLPQRGFVRQEDVSLTAFLANRFGRLYAPDEKGEAKSAA